MEIIASKEESNKYFDKVKELRSRYNGVIEVGKQALFISCLNFKETKGIIWKTEGIRDGYCCIKLDEPDEMGCTIVEIIKEDVAVL